MAQKWIELPHFPLQNMWEHVRPNPIIHEQNKFIAISSTGDVCTFSIDSQQWIKILNIKVTSNDFSVAFDKENNKLYLIGGLKAIYTLCIKTRKVEKHKISVEIDDDPATVFVNGELHIIGGYENGKHFVWDDDEKQLKLLHSIQ